MSRIAALESIETDAPAEHRVAVVADRRVIHVRLILPLSGADIQSIALEDEGGNVLRSWDFARAGSDRE